MSKLTETPGLVSFIVGVYNINNIENVKKSIQSMLNQTYQNIEIILCDDGSKNNNFEKIKEIYQKDKRIIFLKNESNMGLANALNHCLKFARGEFIARQDDDDWSELTRIEKQVKFLNEHQEYDFVSAWLYKVDDDGVWETVKLKEKPENKDFRIYSQHAHAVSVFRRGCLETVNGYRIAKETVRCEDYDLFMRLYASGKRGYNLQEVLYYYRRDRNRYYVWKYRYKINEAIVRFRGFKALKLGLTSYFYVFRPLIAGLFRYKTVNRIKEKLKGTKKGSNP